MKTQNNVELTVLVGNHPIPSVTKDGKTYVEARFGTEYSLKIRNNNYYRIEAVVSVDGVDVISGKPATHEARGYIVDAYKTIEIKGFRSDMNTVGAFKFTKKKKAYAKQATGTTQNVGVIAVACFAERIKYAANNITWVIDNSNNDWWNKPIKSPVPSWPNDYTWTCYNSNSFNCSAPKGDTGGVLRRMSAEPVSMSYSSAPDFSAGTTWGTKMQDSVTEVSFERASSVPFAEPTIYYDTRKSLEKAGISFEQSKAVAAPQAFPRAFASPPPGWQS